MDGFFVYLRLGRLWNVCFQVVVTFPVNEHSKMEALWAFARRVTICVI